MHFCLSMRKEPGCRGGFSVGDTWCLEHTWLLPQPPSFAFTRSSYRPCSFFSSPTIIRFCTCQGPGGRMPPSEVCSPTHVYPDHGWKKTPPLPKASSLILSTGVFSLSLPPPLLQQGFTGTCYPVSSVSRHLADSPRYGAGQGQKFAAFPALHCSMSERACCASGDRGDSIAGSCTYQKWQRKAGDGKQKVVSSGGRGSCGPGKHGASGPLEEAPNPWAPVSMRCGGEEKKEQRWCVFFKAMAQVNAAWAALWRRHPLPQ